MQALIDADILLYEIGAISQYDENKDDPDKEESMIYRNFEWVAELLDDKIRSIVKDSGAEGEPKLFLTSIRHFYKEDYIPNFREGLAVSKPYKGTRVNEKPFHYYNIFHHLRENYDTHVGNGVEADDLMGIEQVSRSLLGEDTIICSRDKDLRMIPGWHYGWECGLQAEFGPQFYSDLGEIELVQKADANGKIKSSKITGGGKAFFFSQCLTGDVVDNIGGLDKCGPVKAHKHLSSCRTEEEYRNVVQLCYQSQLGERDWREKLTEQVGLLWIQREAGLTYDIFGGE